MINHLRLSRLTSFVRRAPLRGAAFRFQSHASLPPSEIYKLRVHKHLVTEDPIQIEALSLLDRLHTACIAYDQHSHQAAPAPTGWLAGMFSDPAPPAEVPKSLYMWGSTGCGKTYLMDLFFDNLPIARKRRIHFHDFMLDVHKRIHTLRNKPSKHHPVHIIANELLSESVLLCFDEFQITDVADAMILKALFEELFAGGLVLLATSNRPPEDLYLHGLQRDVFVPFIPLLRAKADVFSFQPKPVEQSHQPVKAVDYRLEKYLQLNQHIFFHPLGPSSATALTKALAAYLPNHRSIGLHAHGYEEVSLVVYGHLLHVPKVMVGRRTACFRFDDLCNANLGAVDFIELAKVFHIIAVSDVPKLHVLKRNELRRFITLVDALYEHKVLALFTADCPAQELLQLSDADRASSFDEIFAFDRTLSRLLEMQSQDYVRASLELHGGGDGGAVALDRILRDLPRKRDRNQDSMGWVLRKLWHEYRLGSIDEVQNSPQGGGEADFGGEHRQVMRRSAFEVLLADVAERGVRDMKASDPAAEAVVAYVHKHSHPHAAGGKVKHVGFAQFSKELHGLFALLQ